VKDRDLVWHKCKHLSEGHYIRAMFPPSAIHRKRRVLQASSSYAETIPRYKGTTHVTFSNKIMVSKVLCGIDDYPWIFILFCGDDTPLYNLYPSSFVVDNVHYSCNEQYYYHAKAKYYKDYKAEVEILAIHDPVVIKCIGKAIGDYGDDRQFHETAEGFDTMRNPYLRPVFLSTGDSILGETNPYDYTWCIGMGVSNPKAF